MAEFLNIVGTAAGLVAIAEVGDKTQLLSIMLAARFRKPWPIIAGVLVATLANHAVAAWAGAALSQWFAGPAFRIAVGLGFLATALWVLVPDKIDDEEPATREGFLGGVFLTTAIAFFVAEIGDKTQVATVGLGAQFHNVAAVTIGTTLGMMIANVPAIFLGDRVLRVVPMAAVRAVAALVMAGLGALMLWQTLR
ncbi:MAG: TMEM165/GDT1 family protein [Sphingomonadales bacterium]|jgi:putative Ca2+/H+ antiporter (TMEM165/GDT1 family)